MPLPLPTGCFGDPLLYLWHVILIFYNFRETYVIFFASCCFLSLQCPAVDDALQFTDDVYTVLFLVCHFTGFWKIYQNVYITLYIINIFITFVSSLPPKVLTKHLGSSVIHSTQSWRKYHIPRSDRALLFSVHNKLRPDPAGPLCKFEEAESSQMTRDGQARPVRPCSNGSGLSTPFLKSWQVITPRSHCFI